MNVPSIQCIQDAVRHALAEDLAFGDVTTRALFSQPRPARASIVARHSMIVAGIAVAREVFFSVDPSLKIINSLPDGHTTSSEDSVLIVEGDGRSLLMAERVALNFMQRLSGIATLTGGSARPYAATPLAFSIPGRRLPVCERLKNGRSVSAEAITIVFH